jgi:Phage integrase, N-terminal SAM-like domain
MTRIRHAIRVRQYALRTEAVYVGWVRGDIHFHDLRHPQDLGCAEVTAFLTHLAAERQVSASTQSQARAALLFLYREVLGIDLPWLDEDVTA